MPKMVHYVDGSVSMPNHTWSITISLEWIEPQWLTDLRYEFRFWTIELRELAFHLPDQFGCVNDVQKPILRELTKRHLPERIQKKPKQGFSFPLTDFVSVGNMSRTVEHGTLGKAGLLNVAGFRSWNADTKLVSSMKLWLLYTFEQWAKHWLFRSR